MPIILPYNGITPRIASDAFIAENAVIIGDVEIGSGSNIWYNCVIRGDVHHIRIGNNTNIQDGTVIHVSRNEGPTIVGNNVTVGHMALLHACVLKDFAFVGMGAKVIDYSVIEEYGMLAAGSLLPMRKTIGSKELWAGVPAKKMRDLTVDELHNSEQSAINYLQLAKEYS